MKKLIWLGLLSLILFSLSAVAVEREYRMFLKDGSWVRTAGNPDLVDGKAKVRLPAGQLVVFPQSKVDWDRTHQWNAAAADAHQTTAMPLPKGVLFAPVTASENLETVGGAEVATTQGDPRDRLEKRIDELEAQEAEVYRQAKDVQARMQATDDADKARKLGAQLTELNDELRALRAKKNGLMLELKNWR